MNRARFDELLTRVESLTVLVIGDVMLDRYVAGSVDRISPEAPVPIVSVQKEWDAVGGAGNVAANVRAWGARSSLVSVTGRDAAGEVLGDRLSGLGVTPRFVWSDARPTTVKTRVLAQGQQVVRVDREVSTPVTEVIEHELLRLTSDEISDADAVVFEDYNKGVLTPNLLRALLPLCSEAETLTLVDPKWENFFAYDGVNVFKPNARELSGALGEAVRPADEDWMEVVRSRLNCEHLLLTLGGDGMVMATRSEGSVRMPAVARSVYDVSGAGDTVSAAISVALAAGASRTEALTLATHAAAVCVGISGVATVTPDEVWNSIAQRRS